MNTNAKFYFKKKPFFDLWTVVRLRELADLNLIVMWVLERIVRVVIVFYDCLLLFTSDYCKVACVFYVSSVNKS
jgi:hypothetical protein